VKKQLFALAALAAAALSPAHALSTGDLAFTSFNADEDGFSLVSFVNISAGTVVYFTDNEYVSGAFNTGESYFKWTTGAVAAGSVVRFSNVDVTSLAASNGTLARQSVSGSTNYGLSTSADTVYAYQGTSATAPTTFLAAITNASSFNTTDGALAGTGLTEGSSSAIRLTAKPGAANASPDFGQYNGDRSTQTTLAAYKPLLADLNNWTVDTSNGSYATTVPDTAAFTAAVPEPESYALMLAGLASLGFMASRRKQR